MSKSGTVATVEAGKAAEIGMMGDKVRTVVKGGDEGTPTFSLPATRAPATDDHECPGDGAEATGGAVGFTTAAAR